MNVLLPSILALSIFLALPARGDGFLDLFGLGKKKNRDGSSVPASAANLSQDQMVAALKQALSKGVEQAVTNLGQPDGFLKDLNVRIPMPENLKKVERTLRSLRQDRLADEFVTTMNRAAEQAVPEAASVLVQAVQQMTVTDAQGILTGSNNSATQFFRRSSETNLYQRFHPIVKQATEKTGVTSAYKNMLGRVSFAGAFLGADAGDIDAYVTRKTLDGLFLKIADEERRIRENPAARSTELLQKVFGVFQKRP